MQGVHRESGDIPERVRRGSKESQKMVQIECGEGLESLRRGCRERVPESPESVRRGVRESRGGSKESQQKVQRESGDSPKRVRRRSNESQRGSREC